MISDADRVWIDVGSFLFTIGWIIWAILFSVKEGPDYVKGLMGEKRRRRRG